MNSNRPHLVRTPYEWIVGNDYTPHVLVNAEFAGVEVPPGYASDGQIVLNVSPSTVQHLHMDNEAISFEGRFDDVAQSLYIPTLAVMAIYARESGQGVIFDLEQPGPVDDESGDDDGGPSDEPPRPSGRPSLEMIE